MPNLKDLDGRLVATLTEAERIVFEMAEARGYAHREYLSGSLLNPASSGTVVVKCKDRCYG